ncbi:S8 family serine peptidase [Deinococcus yavapaiensis]|uniref:Serine protease n=1 Tax=Deinococcus yavapaiensis KR-236 TaxID=694435 RepID=A0A318SA22_9DEIO|nr:S8 family serine peptidase [Deinococcus yavapaiensis]PYE55228.1 serine protease [Deinococcus yavapaiensis KR-236]
MRRFASFSLLTAAFLAGVAPAIRATPVVTQSPVVPPSLPWNLAAIHLPISTVSLGAMSTTASTSNTIAILDTGYATVPSIRGTVVNGYDFVSDAATSGDGDGRDADATDTGATSYHASMVAGIVASIDPTATFVHVRVADDDGHIRVNDLVDGLRWAAGLPVTGVPLNTKPAKIVNLSLFVDFIPLTRCDARVQSALSAVAARGVIVVAGAGNDDRDASGYSPAGCRDVITVTATDATDRRANYANYGPTITLAAPGGTAASLIDVSTPNGTERQMGTSIAAPHVTGVVSLLLRAKPTLRPAEVTAILKDTATKFEGGACDVRSPLKTCGAGLLNAEAALARVATAAKTSGRSSAARMPARP